jgi:hypothetical protein
MTAIIKTLPGRFARGHLDRFFGTEEKPCFTTYYFTLGRGRPSKTEPAEPYLDFQAWRGIEQLYFSHQGILIGHFAIECIVQNVGQLPLLTTLDGKPSEWQIKPDRWVAVCTPPFHRLEETLYHEGFRGWRYFDLESHRGSIAAKVRL